MPAAVEVWSIDLVAGAPGLLLLEAKVGLLTPDDLAKIAPMLDREGANERLATTIAVRLLLEARCGPQVRRMAFEVGPAGKPMLANGICHFSMSHVRGYALVGLSDDPIGVDVERLRTPLIDAVRQARIEMAATSICADQALPPQADERRFLQAWTRLEAVAKADGRGIGRLLTEIGVIGAGGPAGKSEQAALPEATAMLSAEYGVHDLDLGDGLIGAVSVRRPLHPPSAVLPLPIDLDGLIALMAEAGAARR